MAIPKSRLVYPQGRHWGKPIPPRRLGAFAMAKCQVPSVFTAVKVRNQNLFWASGLVLQNVSEVPPEQSTDWPKLKAFKVSSSQTQRVGVDRLEAVY